MKKEEYYEERTLWRKRNIIKKEHYEERGILWSIKSWAERLSLFWKSLFKILILTHPSQMNVTECKLTPIYG